MAQDLNNPNRIIKFQRMLSKAESDAVDDYRFANRIKSKAAAIRLLVQKGLELEAEERGS